MTANLYLSENFAPVEDELTVSDLPVEGGLPEELEGRYLRNGPNPLGEVDIATHHWFIGDGMVHGVRIRGGRAEWYRNRWVRGTRVASALGEEPPGNEPQESGPNTSVIGFAGRTWALVEAGGVPTELDYELGTVAKNGFFGTLPGAFTAHPKLDTETGELHAMCYWWQQWMDHVQYVVVGADGRVRRTLDIPLPGMTMLHDMSLTQRYALIYDLPVTVDMELAVASRFPFRWNPDYGARVGLLPRDGDVADIVWCEVGLGYAYHPLNAYDTDDGRVVVDLCRYERMFADDVRGPGGDSIATLDRWTIDPSSRKVLEERIDERGQEFPRHNPRFATRRHRYGYTASVGTDFSPGPLYKHDLDAGTVEVHDFGAGRGTGEAVFVAREGAKDEDDGWLMSFVYDSAANTSELVVLNAQDVGGPAVARVLLPRRVPFGFHGDWVPDSEVSPQS